MIYIDLGLVLTRTTRCEDSKGQNLLAVALMFVISVLKIT